MKHETMTNNKTEEQHHIYYKTDKFGQNAAETKMMCQFYWS